MLGTSCIWAVRQRKVRNKAICVECNYCQLQEKFVALDSNYVVICLNTYTFCLNFLSKSSWSEPVALWQAEDRFSGLHFTLKNKPAILEATSDVSYPGKIRSDATECVVSFPGKFASGWDALIEDRYEQSVACVFLCTPEDGLGEHSINPKAPPEASVRCYCPTIYGERSFQDFGYLKTLPKGCDNEEEKRAIEKAKDTKTVVVRADAHPEERLAAERQAKEAWEESGRTASWGCAWFKAWKQKVHEAVDKGQTLKVVYFPGQVGQGKLSWNELSKTYVDPWDGVGCGGSQKCEIAYLDMMRNENPGTGWDYDGVDVINFLKKEFKPGNMVLARDGGRWRKGILESWPKLTERQSTKSGKVKREWTTWCTVKCLETKETFSSDSVRSADGPDGIWRLLDIVGKDFFAKILTENLPEGIELGRDKTIILQDGTPSILFCMKVPPIEAMQMLRGQILSNDLEVAINKALLTKQHGRWQIQVDKTYFCTLYEKQLLKFSIPTDHQQKILKEVKMKMQSSSIHISAIAGAGKTFIAVRLVMDELCNNSSGLILFVAPPPSLCLFFVHWLGRRVHGRRRLREKFSIQSVLERIRVMHYPYKDVMNVQVTGNRLDFQSISQLDMVKENFLLAIIDEAHDVYRDGVDHAFLDDLHAERRVILSNLSQSSAVEQSFPFTPVVKLTEVVRNTKRIVAGAAAFFAAAQERENITSFSTDGPPLKTFIFLADRNKDDLMKLYVKHTIDAIRHLLRTYMGLSLHNRLALIVPDSDFLESFKPRLESALKDQLFGSQFCLESFENSLKLIPPDLLPTDQQELGSCEVPRDILDTIILDHMQNCKGLEQLMVICVGLDAPINLEADVMVARAHIYQALTRAQLHAIIVNEYVQNGWLEFLGMVKFTEYRTFKESAALEETLADAAANMLARVQTAPELTSVKHESATALQPEQPKHRAMQAIQTTQLEPEAPPNTSPRSQAETTVVVMATSVWDTDDNDHRIAKSIKELRFDPRCPEAGCGSFLDLFRMIISPERTTEMT